MSKRKQTCNDDDNDGGGRNCYMKTVPSEALEKAQKNLQCLIDTKISLEDDLEKHLDQIHCINERIAALECKIEKLVADQGAKDCELRMKDEILMIKEDRAKAEGEIQSVRKRLCDKINRLKHCKKDNNNDDDDECGH